MEREKLFKGITIPPPTWNNATHFGTEIQENEQIPNCFFNPNWDNSMDQNDPFESALSSIVSSPNSNHGVPNNGENFVLRELIGRLGGICNSGDISPHSYNTSCYTTPLNSPPKLNLSIENRMNLRFPANNQLPFSADPGFAERAARFSCFGGKSESEFPPKVEESNGTEGADNNFGKFSRTSSPEKPEFGDSMEESSVSEQIPVGESGKKSQSDSNGSRKRKSIPRGKAKEIPSPPSAKDSKDGAENEESNSKRSKENEGNGKSTREGSQKENKDNSKPPEPPKDYIHVRARRGQATDSHSLAERVRREKISERMKFLQDLVPGCNKVTGKAVMLDEIINYVQSLQQQVEFLSMKLSTVNPRTDFNMEALLSKEIFQSRVSLPHNIYPVDTSAQAFPYAYQSQQGANMHTNIANGTKIPFGINPLTAAIRRNMPMASVDSFSEVATPQASPFWGDDLQSFVQMGFGQNQHETFHGSNGTTSSHMKVEI